MVGQKRVTIQVDDGNIIEFRLDDPLLRMLKRAVETDTRDGETESAPLGRLVNKALTHYLFETLFDHASSE